MKLAEQVSSNLKESSVFDGDIDATMEFAGDMEEILRAVKKVKFASDEAKEFAGYIMDVVTALRKEKPKDADKALDSAAKLIRSVGKELY